MAQGVTAKVTDSTSAVLCNHELLASITGVLKRRYEKTRNLRAACRGIRDAYDQGLDNFRLEYGPTTAEELLSFCARLFERGCRPKSIRLNLSELPGEDKEAKDELAAQSLVALAGSAGVLPTTTLSLSGDRFGPVLGRAMLATMPGLESLELFGLSATSQLECRDEELEGGLQALMGGGEDGGDGEVAGSPILSSLRSLSLPLLASLPPIVAACKQLRELSIVLGADTDMEGVFQQLGELPLLRVLCVNQADDLVDDLPLELFPCLPANLTELEFRNMGDQQEISTSEFAGLINLVKLNLNAAPVSIDALCALPTLTSVTMGSLITPNSSEPGDGSTPPPRRWALPPGLESIRVDDLPESCLLAALQPGPAFRELVMNHDYSPPQLSVGKEDVDGEGCLLPSSEASLIEAVLFLGRWLKDESLHVQFWRGGAGPHRLGGCVAGPGQPPSHSRWLAAAAEANPRLSHLQLEGIALSAEDVETIAARFTSLKELHLLWPTTLPPAALPLLARMPQLQRLALSVFGLCHGTAHPGEAAEGQGDQLSASEERIGEALGTLARLYSEGGYGGSLCVQHREQCEGAEGRLRGLLSAAGVELGEGPSEWAVKRTMVREFGEAFYVHRAQRA